MAEAGLVIGIWDFTGSTVLTVSNPVRVVFKETFRHFRYALRESVDAILEFSDKFGHENCVILRDSAKW